jgi:cyclic pyranopterin phosphate synthase
MDAIDQACALGIDLKINTVLLRSQNGSEIKELIDWALARPLTLRFIELMPTKLNQSFDKAERVHGYEIEPLLLERGLTDRIDPADRRGRSTRGPATIYRSALHKGRIGLINPLSCNFCDSCNRLRLGARGNVRLCLFAEQDIEVPKDSPESVEAFMRALIGLKEERHHLEDGDVGNVATFRTIGG